MLDVVGPDELVVIANTGDDIEIYGAYVSPDPDLVTFWLADRIDERGWGLDGDTFDVMDGLRELGVEVWFNLGDRDLAIGIERARALRAGGRLTDAHAADRPALGVRARVLPMSDRPVRTRVIAHGRWWPFQEFMIQGRRRGPGRRRRLPRRRAASAHAARCSTRSRTRPRDRDRPVEPGDLDRADPGDAGDLARRSPASPAPVVAVSPLVRGEVLKGPTAAFMRVGGPPLDSDGIAAPTRDLSTASSPMSAPTRCRCSRPMC